MPTTSAWRMQRARFGGGLQPLLQLFWVVALAAFLRSRVTLFPSKLHTQREGGWASGCTAALPGSDEVAAALP